MKKDAPHLPPKYCRVDTYYRLQNLRWILLFALIAFIAGGSAALIFQAYLVPQYNNSATFVSSSGSDHLLSKNQPDPVLQKQMEQRLIKIFDAREKLADQFYSSSAQVGTAAVVSSDGWLVAYVPGYVSGAEKNWELLDIQGMSYKTDKVVFDKLDKVLYIKITANGLRVVAFPSWSDLNSGNELWAFVKDWQETFIGNEVVADSVNSLTAWQPNANWQLTDALPAGTVLFDNQGEFVGIVNKDNLLNHGWLIEKQITNLLGTGKLQYQALPWQGYFVQGVGKNQENNISGFYLDKVNSTTKNSLLRGDVVMKVNGQEVAPDNLAYLVWTAPSEVQVVVWRAGKEITLSVVKVGVSF